MDLDDLKQSWEEQDKKLNESLKINQLLLTNMKLDKSKKEVKTMAITEKANLILCLGLIPFFIYSLALSSHLIAIISAILSIIISVSYSYYAIIKIKQLKKLKDNNTSILEFQNDLNVFEKSFLKIKKIELILGLSLLFSSIPVVVITLHGEEIFFKAFDNEHLLGTIIIYALGAIITFILGIFWYRFLYENKIKNINKIFNDLNEFRSNI